MFRFVDSFTRQIFINIRIYRYFTNDNRLIAQLAGIRHVAMVFLLKQNAVVNARYAENNSRFTEIHNHGFKTLAENECSYI